MAPIEYRVAEPESQWRWWGCCRGTPVVTTKHASKCNRKTLLSMNNGNTNAYADILSVKQSNK